MCPCVDCCQRYSVIVHHWCHIPWACQQILHSLHCKCCQGDSDSETYQARPGTERVHHVNLLVPSYGYSHSEIELSCLTLSCPCTGWAVVKIGHSNLWPGSNELSEDKMQTTFIQRDIEYFVYFRVKIFISEIAFWV